ncbi:hypothetical protein IVB11_31675 [Bradyrhizobium sp. 177]|nr:hypothetical protein [Bradyrhizobium sp. 177]
MCPLYIAWQIGPGGRKSIQPVAERSAAGGYDQLHHLSCPRFWDTTPLETELFGHADRFAESDLALRLII